MFLNFFFLQVLTDHFVYLPWKIASLLPPPPFKTRVNVLLACRSVYHPHVCLVSEEARERCKILWN